MPRTFSLLSLLSLVAACGGSSSDLDAGDREDATTVPDGSLLADGGADDAGDAALVDPYASARRTCLDTINQLRATNGKAPLSAWTGGIACADEQATDDQQAGAPHGSFGSCGETAQNLCVGSGAAGVESCLGSMWDERLQDGCAGCDACADAYREDCPGCDFYGDDTGDVCGHYVNMNAEYLTEVACGFSAEGGWVVMNFR